IATTAGNATSWNPAFAEHLRDLRVAILADNDEPGRQHAEEVASSVHVVARSTQLVELPSLPEHGDVSDWLDAGGTTGELRGLIAKTPHREPKTVDLRSSFHAMEPAEDDTWPTLPPEA